MKVSIVTTWPPHRDGVALYSAELYKPITELVNVEVIANITQQKELPQSCKKNGGTVSRCWKRGIWYPEQVFRCAFKSRAHVVHLQHGWLLYGGAVSSLLFPVLLCFFRLSRKPCVVTMHTVIRKDAHIYSNFFVNLLAKMAVLYVSRCIIHFCDKVIVHNSLMKKILQTEYNAKKEKITIIPHGVRTSSKKPESSKKGEPFCVLSLGFLREEKGIECLIAGFTKFVEKCPDAKLVIVGGSHAHDRTGHSQSFRHLLSSNLQKQVLFAGFVDDSSLQQLIWNSDIIVLQSTEPFYVEASGALAAVADYGKAVVCSKVPKFQSELQNGKHCLVVEPSDSMGLAQALTSLMENKELRSRLGKNLKEKFKHRNWSSVAKEHVTLYHSILEKPKAECT